MSVRLEGDINITISSFRHTLCNIIIRILYIMVTNDNVGNFTVGSRMSGDIFLGYCHHGELLFDSLELVLCDVFRDVFRVQGWERQMAQA